MKVKLIKDGMVKMIDGQSRIDDCLKAGWDYADKVVAAVVEEVDDVAEIDSDNVEVDAPKRRGRPPKQVE